MENREIKLKAWHLIYKKMYDVKIYNPGIRLITGLRETGEIMASFDDVALLEYTGLKDKNGKEIYEGDIVLRTDEKAKIFFNQSMASFDFEMLGGDCEPMVLSDGWHPEAHTVIGNIYENPELVE